MSLFKGEGIAAKGLDLQARTAPVVPGNCEIWNDANQAGMLGYVNGQNVSPVFQFYRSVTPVAMTGANSPNTLMTAPLSISLANAVGKTLRVFGAGTYNTNAAGTPTVTIAVAVGGVNVLSWTSGATTGGQSNMPWELEGYVTFANYGANANVEAHGNLSVTLGSSAGGATTAYLDTNSAVSANINAQANTNVAVLASVNVANASVVVNQRLLSVEICN